MSEKNIALITGASRGIGKAVLETLAADGCIVIGTATSEKGAAGISEHIHAAGLQGCGMVLNIADPDSVSQLISAVQEKYGPVSILVNNAGITEDNLLMRMKPEQWENVINTNLSGVYRMSKAVMKDMMRARFGRIVSIASVVGVMGNAGQSNYAAAKAGLIGFSKSLAREVGSRGITVNVVAPGFIATDMTEKLPEAQKNAMLAAVPLARLGEAAEIADAVRYLVHAGYVTGETLHVNGGMYMI